MESLVDYSNWAGDYFQRETGRSIAKTGVSGILKGEVCDMVVVHWAYIPRDA